MKQHQIALLALAALAALLFVLAGWLLVGRRITREQRARARRRYLATRGRLAEAVITDVHDDTINYQYQIAGVVYDSSQDVSLFRDRVPVDPSLILGPAYVKYAARNPQESILIAEDWSGLRTARPPLPPSKELLK